MRTVFIAALTLIGVTLAACRTTEEEPVVVEEEPEYDVLYFETVARGARSPVPDTLQTTIRDPETWDNLRTQLPLLIPSRPVDFAQSMLIAVAIPVESGGHQVEIESVEFMSGEEIVVTYILSVPGGDCLDSVGGTAPFQIVATRIRDEPIRFVQRQEFNACVNP